jgi:hypothetical protein
LIDSFNRPASNKPFDMIAIKILCACGQKYAFDAEPTAAGLDVCVRCPVCGSDGTPAANKAMADYRAANPSPVPVLTVAEPQLPIAIPLPRRVPAATSRDRSYPAGKVKRRRPILILGGAAVAVLVFASAVMFGRGPLRSQERGPSSGTASQGIPSTLEALDAWYPEPAPGQNAATYYGQGIEALKMNTAGISELPLLGGGSMPSLGEPIPASMKPALAAMVKANHDALGFLAKGAQYPQCRYPLDFTRGYDLIYRPYPQLEKASLLVELTALHYAENKQPEPAAREVLTSLALADSLANAPSVLSQLLRSRMLVYALTALEQVVNRSGLPSDTATELSRALQKMEQAEARGDCFNCALAGERAMSLAALAKPRQLARALDAPDLRMTASKRSQIKARLWSGEQLAPERAFFEQSFSRLAAARQASFPDRLKADDLGRQLVAEASDKGLAALELLLPSIGRRTALEAQCLARLRLGSTAVALERFRAGHDGRYPATLSQLAPDYISAAPADPFDGQLLRYHPESGGYSLSSIGGNGGILFEVVTAATY